MIGVAVVTAIGWIIGVGFQVDVIARVATVLVIACPHAWVGSWCRSSWPSPRRSAPGTASWYETDLRLRKPGSLHTVIFDKTGTLTKGEFGAVKIETAGGWIRTMPCRLRLQ